MGISSQYKSNRRQGSPNNLAYLSRVIINSSGAGIYILQESKFVYVSPLIEEFTGYCKKEFLGMQCLDFVYPDDRETVRSKAIYNLKHPSANIPYEYRFIKKNGQHGWVMEKVTSIKYGRKRAVMGSLLDVTEKKCIELELERSEEKFRTILERMQDGYYELDLAGNFSYINYAASDTLGYAREELIGQNYRIITPPDEQKRIFSSFNQVYRTGIPDKAFSHKFLRKNGEIAYAESSIDLFRSEDGKINGFHCVSRDITERKQLEEALARSEETYRNILEQMQDAYYEIDLAGNFLFVNEATCAILGIPLNQLIGMNYHGIIPEDDRPSVLNAFNQVFKTGVPNRGFTHRVCLANGQTAFAEVSISLLKDKQGKIIGFRCVGRDITERKRMEQMLADMATHDYLTGLPNRVLLIDRFDIALAQAQRNQNKLAIMSLDLDRFKEVNDTMGHSTGDEVLKQVANRLTATVRSSDTVARLGGDEFLLLLQDIHDVNDATTIADKILSSLKEPLPVEGRNFFLSASIGIAVYPDVGNTLETLMKKSDASMYYSKHHGGCQYKVYCDKDLN